MASCPANLSGCLAQTRQPWDETKWNFQARFDRFIKRRDQFEALASLQAIDQSGALMDQTIDHVLIIGLMAKAIDIWGIDGEFFDHVPVRRKFIDKTPVPDLVHGEARDFNGALLPKDRERAFKIGRACGRGRLDNSQRAVAKL